MKIAVGSTNPTKINAVKKAFEKVFPNETWDIIGIVVGSDVSDQPKSAKEAITGARNRARKAREKEDADFGVGLEGGMQQFENQWIETGWIAVLNRNGIEGIGSSIQMEVPGKMMEMIHQGDELGNATDVFFKTEKSAQKMGFFGLMTDGHIDRTGAYTDGVISALSRFLHPELF